MTKVSAFTEEHAAKIRDEKIKQAWLEYNLACAEMRKHARKFGDRPMPLPVRCIHAIRGAGLSPIEPEKVAAFGRKNFLKTPNFGRNSLAVLERWLGAHGLDMAP